MRCHSQLCSTTFGKWTTMRRTEALIQALNLVNRSRSVLTCARSQEVPLAGNLTSCINTSAAAVISTRS